MVESTDAPRDPLRGCRAADGVAVTTDDDRARRARSFGVLAEDYDRIRPGYPDEAVVAVVGERPCRVVDVGAGTGKLTRDLVARGHEVVAVEPDPGMRTALVRHALPGVRVLDGAGEALPVDDASADAVLYGQAWHWVDPERAAAEAHRVLADDGVLGLLWNIPDRSVRWVEEVNRIAGQPDQGPRLVPPALDGFAPAEVVRVPWVHTLTPDDLVLLFSTFSRVSTREPDDRAAVLDTIVRHPAVAGRTTVAYPHLCAALRFRRRRTPPGRSTAAGGSPRSFGR